VREAESLAVAKAVAPAERPEAPVELPVVVAERPAEVVRVRAELEAEAQVAKGVPDLVPAGSSIQIRATVLLACY
jgi:hypothetical protein